MKYIPQTSSLILIGFFIIGVYMLLCFFSYNYDIEDLFAPEEEKYGMDFRSYLTALGNGVSIIYKDSTNPDYRTIFWDTTEKYTLIDLEKSLIHTGILSPNAANDNFPQKEQWELLWVTKNCFVFQYDADKIQLSWWKKEKQQGIQEAFKSYFWRQSLSWKKCIDGEKCYLYFTEKGFLRADSLYDCK